MATYTLALWVFLSSLICPAVYAWSAQGHAEIAEAAFNQLTKKQKQTLAPVLAAGPWATKSSRRSAIAAAAVWPDRIRDLPLEPLFAQYGSGKIPKSLRRYRQQNTAEWHFVNAHYLTRAGRVLEASVHAQSCPPPAYGELYDIWTPLLDAYATIEDPRDKALVLAFIVHLVGDAYQPLHVFAALDQDCDHDLGGNRYCLEAGKGQRCKTNLHQLWDRGFGVFESAWYQPVRFNGHVRSLATQTNTLARDVYPAAGGDVFTASYQRRARTLVRQQANRATAHLHQVLQQLTGARK